MISTCSPGAWNLAWIGSWTEKCNAVGQSDVRLNLRGPPCFSSNISAALCMQNCKAAVSAKLLHCRCSCAFLPIARKKQYIHSRRDPGVLLLSCCLSLLFLMRRKMMLLQNVAMLQYHYAASHNHTWAEQSMSTSIGFRWLTQSQPNRLLERLHVVPGGFVHVQRSCTYRHLLPSTWRHDSGNIAAI